MSVRVCHTGLGLVTLEPNKGVVEGGDQAGGTHGGHIREVRKGVLGIAHKQLRSCKSILITDVNKKAPHEKKSLVTTIFFLLHLIVSAYFKPNI